MSFPEQLEKILTGDLPGIAAHVKMVTPGRRKVKPVKVQTERVQAAVLALFFPIDNIPHVIFIKRSGDFEVLHGGQLSFPGGRAEKVDDSLQDTALREAQEEIGINAEDVRVLGRLSSLYIPVSNHMVHPFVGWLDHAPELTAQESEVAEILQIPLPHLQKNSTVGHTSIQVSEKHVIDDVPHYDLFGQVLWGATAMITSELLQIIPIRRVS